MSTIENTSNNAAQPTRSRKPKLAKYRPQLTKPEIDLIINCLSAALVSGYNNQGLPGVIKKFKLLAHKIDLDAIGASYSVAEPAKQKVSLPNEANNTQNSNSEDSNDTQDTPQGTSALAGDTPALTEEYCWAKYQALGGSLEAMEQLSIEEQALVSMYKANERMELSKDDETRISAYMIKQLSGG